MAPSGSVCPRHLSRSGRCWSGAAGWGDTDRRSRAACHVRAGDHHPAQLHAAGARDGAQLTTVFEIGDADPLPAGEVRGLLGPARKTHGLWTVRDGTLLLAAFDPVPSTAESSTPPARGGRAHPGRRSA